MLRKFPPSTHKDDFRTSVLGLQFWLRRGHFGPDGRLRVKCRARIGQVYFSESLNVVVGELPEDERRGLQDHTRVMPATSKGTSSCTGTLLAVCFWKFPFRARLHYVTQTCNVRDMTIWSLFNNELGPLKTKSGGGFQGWNWVVVVGGVSEVGILSWGDLFFLKKKCSNCHVSNITWLSHVV